MRSAAKRASRLLVLAMLVALGALSLGVSAASAGTVPDDVFTCKFSGILEIDSYLVYQLDAGADCVHADIDGSQGLNGDTVDNSGVFGAHLSSFGSYERQTLCSGVVFYGYPHFGRDSATTLTGPGDPELPISDFRYTIDLAAGQGTFIFDTATSASGGSLLHVSGQGAGSGYITLAPYGDPVGDALWTACPNGLGNPASNHLFRVNGAFTLPFDSGGF